MQRFFLLSLVLLLLSGPCLGQEKRVADWISDLGADDWRRRERAMHQLRAAGSEAIPALRRARLSPDAERAHRAEKLLAELSWDLGALPERIRHRLTRYLEISHDERAALMKEMSRLSREGLPILMRLVRLEPQPDLRRKAFEFIQRLMRTEAGHDEEILRLLERERGGWARRMAGNIFARNGRLTQALAAFEDFLRRHPDDEKIRRRAAGIAIRLKGWKRALALLQPLQGETDRELLFLRGRAHHGLGNAKAGDALWSRLLDQTAATVDDFHRIALGYQELQKHEAARFTLERGLVRFPESEPLNLALADLLRKSGELVAAFRRYAPVLEQRFSAREEPVADAMASILLGLGLAEDEAENFLEEIRWQEATPELYRTLGRAFEQHGLLDEAHNEWLKGHLLYGDEGEFAHGVARCLHRQGHSRRALGFIEKARRANPPNSERLAQLERSVREALDQEGAPTPERLHPSWLHLALLEPDSPRLSMRFEPEPLVTGNTVLLPMVGGAEVLALARSTGEEKWRYRAPGGRDPAHHLVFAARTPDGPYLFFRVASGREVAFKVVHLDRETGRVRSEKPFDLGDEPGIFLPDDRGRILAVSRHRQIQIVRLLDARQGQIAWQVDRVAFELAGTWTGDEALLASNAGTLTRIDRDGKVVWEREVASDIVVPPRKWGEGVAVAAGSGLIRLGADGTPVWKRTFSSGRIRSLLPAGKRVYVLFEDDRLVACRAEDGASLWERQFSEPGRLKVAAFGDGCLVWGAHRTRSNVLRVLGADGNVRYRRTIHPRPRLRVAGSEIVLSCGRRLRGQGIWSYGLKPGAAIDRGSLARRVLFLLAEAKERFGRDLLAERILRRYLRSGGPRTAEARYRLARILERMGRPEEALKEVEEALKQEKRPAYDELRTRLKKALDNPEREEPGKDEPK